MPFTGNSHVCICEAISFFLFIKPWFFNLLFQSLFFFHLDILEGLSEEAEKCVGLLIVVDVMSLIRVESYQHKFHNLLKCKAVKGKSGIQPCYTTILYVHQGCHEYTYAKKKLEEKLIYSIDIKDKEDTNFKRELLKRLPKKSSARDVYSKYSTFVVDNPGDPGTQSPHCYSRTESNTSTSPLVKVDYM